MQVAISKRRAKRLAAGSIQYVADLGMWYLMLYGIVDDMVVPFGMTPHSSIEQVLADGNETLKTKPEDWVAMNEQEINQYILDHAKNRWHPT